MFNLNALCRFINSNNDGIIQKSEVQNFAARLNLPSIFNDYFNSISNDIDNNTFLDDIYDIMLQAKEDNNQLPQLDFKDDNDADAFYQLCIEQNEKETEEAKEFCLGRYGVKAENMEEFEKLFNQFKKEAFEKGDISIIYQKFKELGYTKPINMEMARAGSSYTINLPDDLVLEDMDWSNSREVFNYLSFNDKNFSKTSKEHLPEGYDPETVFDKGKTIGLGIDEVHDMGYTGRGVSIAVCDWQLKPHKDLNIKEYRCAEHASAVEDYFHASAVTGILAGSRTGIAPDSDVYYFAEYQDFSKENGGNDMINTLQGIIDRNKELPADKKIRVISISGPMYGGEEKTSALVKELADSGVWVLSSEEFWKYFGYLEKKDPMGDPNDFNNYQICRGSDNKNALYVNSGSRTVPYPAGETAYRHDSRASASWAIPAAAGYYALACQADSSMTPDKFLKLADKTARIIESNTYVYDDKNPSEMPIGRSEDKIPAKIIDIKALLQEISKSKENN